MALTDQGPLFWTTNKNCLTDGLFSYSWTNAHRLEVHLPCGGHHRAPSGQGSPCGSDGGSWEERGRTGSARGCWQTERMVSQLDCPLSGEILQCRNKHMNTHGVQGKLFGVEFKFCACEENTRLLWVRDKNTSAHPTDFVLDDRQKTRAGVTGWRSDEEIVRGKRETVEFDSEGQGNQVEPGIN